MADIIDKAKKAAEIGSTAVGAAASAVGLAVGASTGSKVAVVTGAAGLVGAGGALVGEAVGGTAGATAAKVGSAAANAGGLVSSGAALTSAVQAGTGAGAAIASTGVVASGASLAGGLAGGSVAKVTSKVADAAALAGTAAAIGTLAKAFVDARRAPAASAPVSAPVSAPGAPSPASGSGSPAPSANAPDARDIPPALGKKLPEALETALRKPTRPPFTFTLASAAEGEKEAPSSALHVVSLQGTEGLSLVYEIHVGLQMARPGDRAGHPLDMKKVVNERAALQFFDLENEWRSVIFGHVATIELAEVLEHDLVYHAVLVPKLWYLGRNKISWTYVGKSLPDIIREVLKRNGWKELERDGEGKIAEEHRNADYEMCLGTYDPLDQVCQYKESDLCFLSRLMEHWGVYYYFEQTDRRERLVICDHRERHTTVFIDEDGLPIRDETGELLSDPKAYSPRSSTDRSVDESFWSFREKHVGETDVEVKGYDFSNPSLPATSQQPSGKSPALCFHGENVRTQKEASLLARIRKEELDVRTVVYQGEGPVYGLRAGYVFTLTDYPGGGDLLVTAVTHSGAVSGGQRSEYTAAVTAIPAEVQYRPPRNTPKPCIVGVERAVVDGPADDQQYAQLDALGRYLVRIDFDQSGRNSGKASMRVRMLQPHGGAREGFHFPLRKGTEVMLVFLGGDPDRPVIAGFVPRDHQASPVTSKNPTQNVIRTGGGNRIVAEDGASHQYMRISSPTQHSFLRLGAPSQKDGANAELSTDRNGAIHTGADLEVTVGGKSCVTISGNVQGGKASKVDVTGDHELTASTSILITCGGNQILIDPGQVLISTAGGATALLQGNTISLNSSSCSAPASQPAAAAPAAGEPGEGAPGPLGYTPETTPPPLGYSPPATPLPPLGYTPPATTPPPLGYTPPATTPPPLGYTPPATQAAPASSEQPDALFSAAPSPAETSAASVPSAPAAPAAPSVPAGFAPPAPTGPLGYSPPATTPPPLGYSPPATSAPLGYSPPAVPQGAPSLPAVAPPSLAPPAVPAPPAIPTVPATPKVPSPVELPGAPKPPSPKAAGLAAADIPGAKGSSKA
jgi:type VI secretion system secreted protein VgrG